jgi:hypothetical protein
MTGAELVHKQAITSGHEHGGVRAGVSYSACNIRAPLLFTYANSRVTCPGCIERIEYHALQNLHVLVQDARAIANALGPDRAAVKAWMDEVASANQRLRSALQNEDETEAATR